MAGGPSGPLPSGTTAGTPTSAGTVGSPKKTCPAKKATLTVTVFRTDSRDLSQPAQVTLKGPSGSQKQTASYDSAEFANLDPGSYEISVTLGAQSAEKDFEFLDKDFEAGNGHKIDLNAGDVAWAVAKITSKPKLKVKVVEQENHPRVFGDATVRVTGAQSHPDKKTGSANGIADFDSTNVGKYSIEVLLTDGDKQTFANPSKITIELAQGEERQVVIEVEKLNVVTPKLEMEYKVVLYDRNLAQYQEASEEKLSADPTYVVLSFEQSRPHPHAYARGGKLKCSPANVEAYLDEKCTKKLAGDLAAGAPVTNEQLANKLTVYLKGKTRGKYQLSLKLEESTDPFIKVDTPSKEEMGVVELESTLHRFDKGQLDALEVNPGNDPIATYHANLKAKDLPPQKPMTDAQKVNEGRLLHVQDGKHHGRAKLVVKKLAADQWPAGTDEYDITCSDAQGRVTLFDAETEGAEKPLPLKIKVKDLKAKELEYWVQGTTESEKARDTVMSVGLDREPGGLAKGAKANGDWCRFTVVKIMKVELVVNVPAGKPKVWDGGRNRYYINTQAGAAGRTLGDSAGNREVKVVAALTKAIADIPIHFMLAAHPDNAAPAGLPPTWKPETLKVDMRVLDRKDRKALMHFSARTNADGKADMKQLVLSAFGGNKFTPSAYIEQDPHLAKYVEGHADLGTRVPVRCADTLQVWKYFDYRIVYMKRHDGTSYSNRFTEADLQAKFAADFIEMASAGALVTADHADMVPYDSARDWVIGKLGAEKPRQLQFAFVDAIGKTPELPHELTTVGVPGLTFPWPIPGGQCFDMSAQNKWLQSASYTPDGGTAQAIPGSCLVLQNDGPNHKLAVDLTSIAALASVDLTKLALRIVLIKHDFPSGLSWGAPTLVGMRWREAGFPGQEAQATMRTAYHEAGHYLSLAPKTLPDTAASASPRWYNSPGVGNHCNYGPEECTLWHQFIMKIDFCPTCKLALRARDHASNVAADTPF